MRIRYADTLDDLVAFSDFHAAHSTTVKQNIRLTRWTSAVLVIALTFAALTFVTDDSMALSAKVFGALVGGVFMFVVVPHLTRWNLRVQMRKILREGRNKSVVGEHELEILDEGLLERTEYNETKSSWAGIERVVSTPQYTFIYITSVSAHVIPRESVSEGDYDAFIQELTRRIHAAQHIPSGSGANAEV
jgi:hypothetical protein